jgi:hypothetical protein
VGPDQSRASIGCRAPALQENVFLVRGNPFLSLLLAAREWGKEFGGRVNLQRLAEQVRHHLSRVAPLRPRAAEAVKENSSTKIAVAEKITPSVEEMAQKLREKVRERNIQKQKVEPAPAVKTKIDWNPVPSHRQGRGIGL